MYVKHSLLGSDQNHSLNDKTDYSDKVVGVAIQFHYTIVMQPAKC